ncbi:hypothetical protein H2248_000292 [Termitomyces sp. 'cryptogamus']|nr:hypothetical protein H2248_000292 [Termitomyces sp. 'cryptogamus']
MPELCTLKMMPLNTEERLCDLYRSTSRVSREDYTDTASKGSVLAMIRELAMVHAKESKSLSGISESFLTLLPDGFLQH